MLEGGYCPFEARYLDSIVDLVDTRRLRLIDYHEFVNLVRTYIHPPSTRPSLPLRVALPGVGRCERCAWAIATLTSSPRFLFSTAQIRGETPDVRLAAIEDVFARLDDSNQSSSNPPGTVSIDDLKRAFNGSEHPLAVQRNYSSAQVRLSSYTHSHPNVVISPPTAHRKRSLCVCGSGVGSFLDGVGKRRTKAVGDWVQHVLPVLCGPQRVHRRRRVLCRDNAEPVERLRDEAGVRAEADGGRGVGGGGGGGGGMY